MKPHAPHSLLHRTHNQRPPFDAPQNTFDQKTQTRSIGEPNITKTQSYFFAACCRILLDFPKSRV